MLSVLFALFLMILGNFCTCLWCGGCYEKYVPTTGSKSWIFVSPLVSAMLLVIFHSTFDFQGPIAILFTALGIVSGFLGAQIGTEYYLERRSLRKKRRKSSLYKTNENATTGNVITNENNITATDSNGTEN